MLYLSIHLFRSWKLKANGAKSLNIAYFPGVHMILSNPYMFLVLLRPSDLKILLKCLRLVPAYTHTVKTFQHAPDD